MAVAGPVSLFQRLQVDRTLLFALATRLWQAGSGPLTLYLVVASLSLEQQSVYYGVASVLAIQSLLELGTLNVLVGQAGYLAGGATSPGATSPGASTPGASTSARLGQLAVAADRWFGWLAIGFVGLALAVGGWLFSRVSLPPSVHWQGPLVAVVLCAGYSVAAAGRAAVVEGAGGRQLVHGTRLAMAVVGSGAVWAVLLAGGGLWCLLAAGAVQAIAIAGLVHSPAARRLLPRQSPAGDDFSWRRDVLPSQWRMALISAGYHLATQLFPLFLLAADRAADAARLGMTLAITTAIQMLALAWAQTRYPMIASLHGQRQRAAAGAMWRQTARVSTLLLVAALAAAVLLVAWLPGWDARFDQRLISAGQAAVLGLGCVANHAVALLAFYILASRRQPVVATAAAYGITAGVTAWAAFAAGTNGIVVAYAGCFWGLVLPVQLAGYRRLQRRAEQPASSAR